MTTIDLLNGLFGSWRKTPLFAPEGEGSGGSDGNGEGGSDDTSDASGGGGGTVLGDKPNEGAAGGDGAGEGGDGEGAGDADADPRDAVPEDGKYEFVFEGGKLELSDEAQAAYAEAFKGLTQKQVDAIVAADVQLAQKAEEDADSAFKTTIGEWLDEAKTDKELGADWNATLATANRAIETFGDDDFRKQLDGTGLGNHPAVLRMLSKVGKAISEDKFQTGDSTQDAAPVEERFYGKTTPTKKRG